MMTTRIKKTLLIMLSALLSLTALFCVLNSPASAKADTESHEGTYFTKTTGCQIALNPDFYKLRVGGKNVKVYPVRWHFKNTANYAHFSEIDDFANELLNDIDDSNAKINLDKTWQVYELSLRHRPITSTNAGGNNYGINDIITIRIVFGLNGNGTASYAVSVYRHDKTLPIEYFDIPKYENINTEPSAIVKEKAEENGFEIINSATTTDAMGADTDGTIAFVAFLSSYEEHYDIAFNFSAQRSVRHGFLNWGDTTEKFVNTTQFSDIRSYKDWVEASYNAGLLEEEVLEAGESFEGIEAIYEQALAIATENKYKDITISYLVPIEGTPFATRTTMQVKDVPVNGTEVAIMDVRAQTGKDFNIFNTTAYYFYTEDGLNYIAYYLTDSYLTAETKGGHTIRLFFDLNTSFADAYYPAVAEGLITEREYEWALSQIYSLYPTLLGDVENKLYYETEIYGRFGIVSIPEKVNTLNGIFAKFFGEEVKTLNLKILYSKDAYLTIDQYEKLLSDYKINGKSLFSFYVGIWEDFFSELEGGSHDATHYLFYTAPGEAIIEEEDNLGGAVEDIKDGVGDLLGGIGDIFEETVEETKSFFDNVKDWFTGGVINSKARSALISIAVIAVLGAGVYIFIRYKNKKK